MLSTYIYYLSHAYLNPMIWAFLPDTFFTDNREKQKERETQASPVALLRWRGRGSIRT